MSFKTHLDVPFRVHNTVESGLLGDHGITAFSFYEDDVSEPFSFHGRYAETQRCSERVRVRTGNSVTVTVS